jgi:hypothetical protein
VSKTGIVESEFSHCGRGRLVHLEAVQLESYHESKVVNLQKNVTNLKAFGLRSSDYKPALWDDLAISCPLGDSYLVDPASSHMLVSKIKPCMSKFKQ